MNDKQMVRRRSKEYDIDQDTIQSAINILQGIAKEYHKDVKIEFQCKWEGDTSFKVCYMELETEEEAFRRTNIIAINEQARRKQYEALKKEFEEKA